MTIQVINRATGRTYTFSNPKAARTAIDRMDGQHGAHVCIRQVVR